MNINKLIIFSILLLLLNFFILNTNKIYFYGKISKMEYSKNKITLYLDNKNTPLIIFNNKILEIKEKDFVKIYGKKEKYNNKDQVIISKIIKYQVKESLQK
jgi:hypothetical protein